MRELAVAEAFGALLFFLAEQRDAGLRGAPLARTTAVYGIRRGYDWLGRLQRLKDWTDGCIALTNPEIDEFCRVVSPGTPIEIRS